MKNSDVHTARQALARAHSRESDREKKNLLARALSELDKLVRLEKYRAAQAEEARLVAEYRKAQLAKKKK